MESVGEGQGMPDLWSCLEGFLRPGEAMCGVPKNSTSETADHNPNHSRLATLVVWKCCHYAPKSMCLEMPLTRVFGQEAMLAKHTTQAKFICLLSKADFRNAGPN